MFSAPQLGRVRQAFIQQILEELFTLPEEYDAEFDWQPQARAKEWLKSSDKEVGMMLALCAPDLPANALSALAESYPASDQLPGWVFKQLALLPGLPSQVRTDLLVIGLKALGTEDQVFNETLRAVANSPYAEQLVEASKILPQVSAKVSALVAAAEPAVGGMLALGLGQRFAERVEGMRPIPETPGMLPPRKDPAA